MGRHIQSSDKKILARIYGSGRGCVFTPAHFRDLGSPDAIHNALSRHTRAGTVRQLARGLYDYPVQHPALGTVAPSADAIARALVARDAVRLQPAGAYAANVLGLSDQVPARIVFLTDGAARKVRVGKQEIILKRTTPRIMATAQRKSGTLIQGLRHLGQDRIDDQVIATLRRQITDADRVAIRKDLRFAPAWVAEILRKLIGPAS